MSWNKGVEISAAAMFSTSSSSGNDTHFWAIELVFAGLPAEKTPFTTSFWLWQIDFQGLFLKQSSGGGAASNSSRIRKVKIF